MNNKIETNDSPIISEYERAKKWWAIHKEYNTEIEKEVEQRIQKRLKEEEHQKKIEEHQKLYPIGSFIEYLGVTMLIKDNLSLNHYSNYISKDLISVRVEWKDKLDQIQTRTFWPDDFKYLNKVDDYPIDDLEHS